MLGAERLGIEELRASIDPSNHAFQQVMNACGFCPTGRTEITPFGSQSGGTLPTWTRGLMGGDL